MYLSGQHTEKSRSVNMVVLGLPPTFTVDTAPETLTFCLVHPQLLEINQEFLGHYGLQFSLGFPAEKWAVEYGHTGTG